MEDNLWGHAFFLLALIVLFIMLVYFSCDMGRSSQWNKYAARYGLNGLLKLYKNKRNESFFYLIYAIFLCCMMYFQDKFDIVSGLVSFSVCLTVLVGSCLWTIRPVVSMERRPRTDYRIEAAKHVTGDSKNVPALFNKLDGEIKRGESILQPHGPNCSYNFLFPSAIVARNETFSASPRIIPTDNVAYMSYLTKGKFKFVYLYDKHRTKLGGVSIDKVDNAIVFMSELEKRFGVQRDAEAEPELKKKHNRIF